MERITINGFTWEKREHASQETWSLVDAVDLIGCTWYCKNYGHSRFPGSSFSGWRCGSGGPWPEEYSSRDEAMTRVVPYLRECMKQNVKSARRNLARVEAIYKSHMA